MDCFKKDKKFRCIMVNHGSGAPKLFFVKNSKDKQLGAVKPWEKKIKGFSIEPRRETQPKSTPRNAKTLSCLDTR